MLPIIKIHVAKAIDGQKMIKDFIQSMNNRFKYLRTSNF